MKAISAKTEDVKISLYDEPELTSIRAEVVYRQEETDTDFLSVYVLFTDRNLPIGETEKQSIRGLSLNEIEKQAIERANELIKFVAASIE